MKPDYTLNKKIVSKAIALLVRVILMAVKSETPHWISRLQLVIEVEDGIVKNKFANITVSTNFLLENDTTIIDRKDLEVGTSQFFETMIKKL
jgi:hypothetical protein